MLRSLVLVPLLVACGPSEEERQAAADSALTAMGITETNLSGEQGAYTFTGQRHGHPCEGRVSVEDPAAPRVEPGVCAPPDGTAELALYDHASRIFHTENLALTGIGGAEVGLTATRKGDACTGTATRQPWGMLDAKLKCGALTLTARCLKADRPATEAEQQALLSHIQPAVEARGLSKVALEDFGCFPSFSGVKRGEPCHGKVEALANADGEVEVELDEARCPGALPPPEALVDPGAFLAWYLVEKQGLEAPRVTARGGGWCLATTVDGKRYVGGAALQGGRIEATVRLGSGSRFFKVPVPEQARQGRTDGTAPTGCTD